MVGFQPLILQGLSKKVGPIAERRLIRARDSGQYNGTGARLIRVCRSGERQIFCRRGIRRCVRSIGWYVSSVHYAVTLLSQFIRSRHPPSRSPI